MMNPMRLPAPQNQQHYARRTTTPSTTIVDPNALVPPYGSRTNYIPRKIADYGDGGAFPEIHVKQYPLDIGRKRGSSNALQLRVDKKGKVNYDVVLRDGERKGKNMWTSLAEMEETAVDESTLNKPSKEQTALLLKKVRKAAEKKLDDKLSTGPTKKSQKKPIYFRYTPANSNAQHNSGANSRVIKLHTMQVDPMEPPKFRIKKHAAGPPSPPVPILHSPTRVISVEDQKNWKIPPCVSNWKNNKGYTIPLHQRLANSGRGLQNTHINDRFASFSEALFYAERNARRMINERARINRKKQDKLRSERESRLSKIAQNTRNQMSNFANREIETPAGERGNNTPAMSTPGMPGTPGVGTPGIGTPGIGTPGIGTPGIGTPGIGTPAIGTPSQIGTPRTRGGDTPGLTSEDIRAKDERDRLRKEALRRRKRERNLAKAKGAGVRPSRDISEQIALGQNVNVQQGGEALFDQRLFNRSSGLDSGFGAVDDYNIYDKPLMSQVNKRMYRPKKLDDDDAEDQSEIDKLLKQAPKFAPHKGFEGAEDAKPTDGPVQFEKHVEENADPFGLQDVESKPTSSKRKDKGRERKRSKERERPRERRRDRDRSRERDRRRQKKRKRSRSKSPPRERKRRKKEKRSRRRSRS